MGAFADNKMPHANAMEDCQPSMATPLLSVLVDSAFEEHACLSPHAGSLATLPEDEMFPTEPMHKWPSRSSAQEGVPELAFVIRTHSRIAGGDNGATEVDVAAVQDAVQGVLQVCQVEW